MNDTDAIGYLASLLVLATFSMRSMITLRAVAVAGNVAFIAYGLAAAIQPVLLLHVVLLPVNTCRLIEALRARRRELPATPGPVMPAPAATRAAAALASRLPRA
jgi:hypothetical protein